MYLDVLFATYTFGIVFKKPLLILKWKKRYLLYFLPRFIYFSSYISVCEPLNLNFCILCEVQVQLHCLPSRYSVVPVQFVKRLLSPFDCLGIFVQIQLAIDL